MDVTYQRLSFSYTSKTRRESKSGWF